MQLYQNPPLQPGSYTITGLVTLIQFCPSLPHHERITATNGSRSTRTQIWVLIQLCDSRWNGQEVGHGSHCTWTKKPYFLASNSRVGLIKLRTAGILIIPILQIRKLKLRDLPQIT